MKERMVKKGYETKLNVQPVKRMSLLHFSISFLSVPPALPHTGARQIRSCISKKLGAAIEPEQAQNIQTVQNLAGVLYPLL